MLLLYQFLLRLYPKRYRDEFTAEMMAVLGEGQQAISGKGFGTRSAFAVREVGGLLLGALREHYCSLTGSYPFDLFPSWRLNMRSQFKFPRSTAALMAVILAVVLLTIEKAKGIQLAHSDGSGGMIVWSILLSALAQMFAIVALLAGLGWLLMFALGRSGVHRLSKVEARPEST